MWFSDTKRVDKMEVLPLMDSVSNLIINTTELKIGISCFLIGFGQRHQSHVHKAQPDTRKAKDLGWLLCKTCACLPCSAKTGSRSKICPRTFLKNMAAKSIDLHEPAHKRWILRVHLFGTTWFENLLLIKPRIMCTSVNVSNECRSKPGQTATLSCWRLVDQSPSVWIMHWLNTKYFEISFHF